MAPPKHALYAASVREFLTQRPESVAAALALRGGAAEPAQKQAWIDEIRILRQALQTVPAARSWGLLLEYSLGRLGDRPDAVILAPGVIMVIEFKTGAGARRHSASFTSQAVDYACCIRDFHGSARQYIVAPIVCVESAPDCVSRKPTVAFGQAQPILSNATDLSRDLRVAASLKRKSRALSWKEFDSGPYIPVPTIIEAAQAIYARHTVADIKRADAGAVSRQRTARRLRHWVSEAQRRKRHVICMVTGTPGAGKTLLGLDLVFSKSDRRTNGRPAVLLTGNTPLIRVLKEAIIRDAKTRGQHTKDTNRALKGPLQSLNRYLKQHTGKKATPPPERVIVFDEAQRAWDEKTGMRRFKRPKSEPALFLESLRRLDWVCLVCLIGEKQEINVGEGGVELWQAALEEEARAARPWHIICADSELLGKQLRVEVDRSMRLNGHDRAYRNPLHINWVDALVSGDLRHAAEIAKEIKPTPALMTRDLEVLRVWLMHWRGRKRRVGLLTSSAAALRLRAHHIQAPPTSSELPQIAKWFVDTHPSFLSSDAIEIPLSEFGCQGLELDFVGLAWGGDLIWSDETSNFAPRKIRGLKWNRCHKDQARFRVNSYRVLLTRAREGLCIFVPRGDPDDPTRSPAEFDKIADKLREAGCHELKSLSDISSVCEPPRSKKA